MSASNPRRTCNEVSKSSVKPILAYVSDRNFTETNSNQNLEGIMQKNIDIMVLTNHRGDSGMKNSPGISTRHGNAPIREIFLVKSVIEQFHNALQLYHNEYASSFKVQPGNS